jgi:hypothetical protein
LRSACQRPSTSFLASKLGAHAVVDAEIWNVMGGPRARGRAVRFASADIKPPGECQWY